MKRNIMMKFRILIYTYMYVPTKPLFQKKKKIVILIYVFAQGGNNLFENKSVAFKFAKRMT